MKNKFWSFKFLPGFIAIAALIFAYGCKEQDELSRKYAVEGGISYPGKALNVKACPGRECVEISWLNTDPAVTNAKIFWNNYHDSLLVNIPAKTDMVVQIVNVPEGDYSFFIKTCDAKGNVSVPVEVFGRALGERYEQSLSNRILKNAVYVDEKIVIDWSIFDDEIGAQLEYTDSEGEKQTIPLEPSDTQTILNMSDVNTGELIYWYSTYRPETAIDIFRLPAQSSKLPPVWVNITQNVLTNYEESFATTGTANAWGYFQAAGWNHSADVAANGPVLNSTKDLRFWVYYGNAGSVTVINNGYLYQTVELEAGMYRFYAHATTVYSEVGTTNYQLYLLAASGNAVPDIGDVEDQALGFTDVPFKVGVNSFEFEVPEKGNVSLGFVMNLYHAQIIVFGKFELWQLK